MPIGAFSDLFTVGVNMVHSVRRVLVELGAIFNLPTSVKVVERMTMNEPFNFLLKNSSVRRALHCVYVFGSVFQK